MHANHFTKYQRSSLRLQQSLLHILWSVLITPAMFARQLAQRSARTAARTYATVSEASGVKVAGIDNGQPTTSISVVVKAGSRFESRPGVAHALKNFAFKVSLAFAFRSEQGGQAIGMRTSVQQNNLWASQSMATTTANGKTGPAIKDPLDVTKIIRKAPVEKLRRRMESLREERRFTAKGAVRSGKESIVSHNEASGRAFVVRSPCERLRW